MQDIQMKTLNQVYANFLQFGNFATAFTKARIIGAVRINYSPPISR